MDHQGQERHLVVANAYPREGDLYRNQFLHTRVLAYQRIGLQCDVYVVDYSTRDSTTSTYDYEGVSVRTGSTEAFGDHLAATRYAKLLVHFPMPYILDPIRAKAPDTPAVLWLHGYETEAWWRRWFNHLEGDRTPRSVMAKERATADRRLQALRAFLDERPETEVVSVSDWFRVHCIEPDLARPLPHASVIPNFIDSTLFAPVAKPLAAQRRVLVLRPFTHAKYGGRDILETILEVARVDPSIAFTLCGDGPAFDDAIERLKACDNVEIRRGFLTRSDVAEVHRAHGVFLNPSWWDSQGVSTGEAMASGLAVVTTDRAAIPEFVEHGVSGLLSQPGDVGSMAQHVLNLCTNDELRQQVSGAARQRVLEQCGFDATIRLEADLIRGDTPSAPSPAIDWPARYAELSEEFSDVICRLGARDTDAPPSPA